MFSLRRLSYVYIATFFLYALQYFFSFLYQNDIVRQKKYTTNTESINVNLPQLQFTVIVITNLATV